MKLLTLTFSPVLQLFCSMSDGGYDREALEKEFREVYREEIPEDTPFFLQIKSDNVFNLEVVKTPL